MDAHSTGHDTAELAVLRRAGQGDAAGPTGATTTPTTCEPGRSPQPPPRGVGPESAIGLPVAWPGRTGCPVRVPVRTCGRAGEDRWPRLIPARGDASGCHRGWRAVPPTPS